MDNNNITITHDDLKTLGNYKTKLTLENMQRIIMAFCNTTEPLKKLLSTKNIGESLSFNDIIQLIKEGFDLYSFVKKNEEVRQIINGNEVKFLEYANILAECNWTPFRNVSIEHVENIITTWHQYNKFEKIDDAMVDYFKKEKLQSLYERWGSKPFLKKRLHILSQAMDAHMNVQYYLSIPIILSQLEGMIADIFNHKGEMHEPAYKAYLKELISLQEIESYAKLYDRLFAATIMISFAHGTKLTSQLSRHAILHGASVTHGTAQNSLKLILFFDLIQDCAKYCCYNDNNKFHLAGCYKIKKIDWKGQEIKSTNIQNYEPVEYFQVSTNKGKIYYYKKKIVFYNSFDEVPQTKSPCKCCVGKFLAESDM